MSDCVTLSQVENYVSYQSNRLIGKVIKAAVSKSPYMDMFPGGKLPNNEGAVFRVSRQERTSLASSLVNPVFTADAQMCGVIPPADRNGTKEFTLSLGTLRGRSNPFCVKLARQAFLSAFERESDAMADGIKRLVNSEARAQGLVYGGTKVVCDANAPVDACLAGGEMAIGTPFPGARTPNAALTFDFMKRIANIMRDSFHLEPFDSNQGAMIKFIGSTEITDRFRREVDIRADLRACLTGKYKLGEELVNSFEFNGPFQEIGLAIDPQPLRAIVANGPTATPSAGALSPNAAPFTTSYVPGYAPADNAANGLVLAFVEPEITVTSTNGFGSRTNPAWLTATYEVAMMAFDDSFVRLTPEPYSGEGGVKFPEVVGLEMLDWYAGRDRDCNRFGDYGDWAYQISRAYQPDHAEAICSFLYKRCPLNSGLIAC